MLFMEGLMDPLSAIGLWTLALVGIGAVVSVARAEANHQRKRLSVTYRKTATLEAGLESV
jgi:hypothetical protein